nr:MAG TPA: hypothetical protein [Bacteriophage sp.]
MEYWKITWLLRFLLLPVKLNASFVLLSLMILNTQI